MFLLLFLSGIKKHLKFYSLSILDPAIPNVTAAEVTASSINISWTADSSLILSIIRVIGNYGSPNQTDIEIGNNGVIFRDQGTTANILNLHPGTDYYISVMVVASSLKLSEMGVLQRSTGKLFFFHISLYEYFIS